MYASRRLQPILLMLLGLALSATSFAQGDPRLVLKGYDPVAYFTEGKPVKGLPELKYDWDGGRYQFSKSENREKFAADPERYAPQFAGYCTGSMSRGVRNEGNPEGWAIVDGKLYVLGLQDGAKARALLNDPNYLAARIPKAEKNWREKTYKGPEKM